MSEQQRAGVIPVRQGIAIDAKQEVPYFVGISAQTVGARQISMQRVIFPPATAARPHIHAGHETAIYILQGSVETRYGRGLREVVVSGPGEFLFVGPDVPHQSRNLSETEPVIAIAARSNPDEQEHVIPYDPAGDDALA